MAFRFILMHGKERQELGWYNEVSPMTAPMAIGQVRAVFPKAAISIERDNRNDAKDANQIGQDLEALKEK